MTIVTLADTKIEQHVVVPTAHPSQERFRLRGATPSRVGMRFDPRLSFEDWRDLGARLGIHATASNWWLGDWLVFGRAKYDRRYRRAIAVTGLDYQTLRNYAMVARRFDMSRRRQTLSFQHHAEVCAHSDEEQDYWLDEAGRHGWTRNELRRRLRACTRSLPEAGQATFVRISVKPQSERRWRDAATRCSCDFTVWVVRTLDQGAESALRPRGGSST